MFKTKRFTPELLDRYRALGRGRGTMQDYVPWHRVGRSDPSSFGRSHLLMWRDRQRELLSDLEWEVSLFSVMQPHIEDLREQFPLALESAPHELAAYDLRHVGPQYPGTESLAGLLQIKHPRVRGNGRSAPWVMTTDLVLTLKQAGRDRELVAIACKYDNAYQCKRTRELLELERNYWAARRVPWLLVAPSTYDKSVGLTLRHTFHWALCCAASQSERNAAIAVTEASPDRSITQIIDRLGSVVGSRTCAQRAFWQAVWSAELPLDLRRGWRPHIPPVRMAKAEFFALNPVVARRSAWI